VGRVILLYGFLLGLVVVLLGCGSKYRDMSRAEQQRAMSLIRSEFEVNDRTMSELVRNLETLVDVYDSTVHAVRNAHIPVLGALFPEANLRRSFTDPSPAEVAATALQDIAQRALDHNPNELARADAAGKLIVATIQRTKVTIRSLADSDHRRYVFREEAYRTQLPILRRIAIVRVTDIEGEYADLTRVRAAYDAVVAHLTEYLNALETFFAPSDNEVTVLTLTRVLTAERMATNTLMSFTPDLIDAANRLQAHAADLPQG
jgi:hypothetical protein